MPESSRSSSPSLPKSTLAGSEPTPVSARGAEWFYARDKQKLGPYSWGELRHRATTGELQAEDMVWQRGTQRWLTASTVPGLFPPKSAVAPTIPSLNQPQPPTSKRPAKRWPSIVLALCLIVWAAVISFMYLNNRNWSLPWQRSSAQPKTEATQTPTPDRRDVRDRQLTRVAVVWADNPAQALDLLDDPSKCPVDLRDRRWEGFHRLCQFDRSLLTRSQGEITALATTPNGTMLASSGVDGTIRLWDVSAAQLSRTLKGHAAPVSALAFRSDGKALLSGDRAGRLKYWDLTNGKEHAGHFRTSALADKVEEPARSILAAAMTFDGRTLAVAVVQPHPENSPDADRSYVELWDVLTGRLRTILRDVSGPLAFSPDGRTLAIGGRLWDAAKGTPRAVYRRLSTTPRAVAFTPDGAVLALGIDAGRRDGRTLIDSVLWDVPGAFHVRSEGKSSQRGK